MQQYPRWMYHKETAPDGRLINTPEQAEALGAGWVTTPAAFDPNYVPPIPIVPDGTIPEGIVGFVPCPYPAHRYSANGDVVTVNSKAEEDALDPDVWKDSPAKFPALAVAAPVISFPSAPTAAPSASAGSLGTATDAEQKAAQEMAAKATDLHNTPITEITKVLEGCPDVAVLRNVKQLEALNPAGPRITLIRFIDNAVKAIEAPPASADATPAQ